MCYVLEYRNEYVLGEMEVRLNITKSLIFILALCLPEFEILHRNQCKQRVPSS